MSVADNLHTPFIQRAIAPENNEYFELRTSTMSGPSTTPQVARLFPQSVTKQAVENSLPLSSPKIRLVSGMSICSSKQRRVPGTLVETPEISFETMDGFLVQYCFFIFFISFHLFIYRLTTTMEYFLLV
ncbi:hypothetical protein BDV39DRAFT_169560 [Aspergillus sergii]|uniref:Uncharacterized protein n=1 Tax=Aspergillus sergii TaxID=1034303 RepID=A0A5N6XD73_9EURO|nr:hypothetical protein BDV39DRAFT_169560 [Aspergillus sergii]